MKTHRRHFLHLRRRTRNRLRFILVCAVVVAGCIFGITSAVQPILGSRSPIKPAADFTKPSGSAVSSGSPHSPQSSSSRVPASSKEPLPSAGPASTPESAPESSGRADSLPGSCGSLPTAKTVYLTFDDGPSSLTGPLLDVLDQYQVKATFFVVGVNDANETQDLKEIARRGHAIGVHSWTHNYRQIYASPEAFFEDFDRIHKMIYDVTGVDTKICRFPGGSVNDFNRKTRKAIISELKQRGYVYFDWNVSSGDAAGKTTASAIYTSALQGVHKHHTSVVLFHNTSAKSATLSQVPNFIATLKKEGYRFSVLSPSVDNTPFIF